MKNIILLLSFLLVSCTSLHLDYEKVQNIEVIYEPSPELRNSPLKIPVRYEGTKKKLINELNNSKKTLFRNAIKEALEEGQYEIHIKYNKKESKDVFVVINSEDLFRKDELILYKNKHILNFLRSMLFSELIERKIKLE